MAASFSTAQAVVLRGLAQVVFTETSASGIAVLAGLILISPWVALGAVMGSVLGSGMGHFFAYFPKSLWRIGYTGYNCSILGIFSAGWLSQGGLATIVIMAIMVACAAFEMLYSRLMTVVRLPMLSAPVVTVAMLTSLFFAGPGSWWWIGAPESPLGEIGIFAGAAFVVLAMAIHSLAATLQAVLLGAAFALIYQTETNIHPFESLGLSVFTVIPASFCIHGVFFRRSGRAAVLGLVAALSGAAVWWTWQITGLDNWFPPLLIPLILGAWCAFFVDRLLRPSPILDQNFWRTIWCILKARRHGKSVVVLQGPLSGELAAFLTSELPFRSSEFRTSKAYRQSVWAGCERLRRRARQLRAEAALNSILVKLERAGWLTSLTTQSLTGSLQLAGAESVIEISGNITATECLGCGKVQRWPPAEIWRRLELRCPHCRELIRPAISSSDADSSQAISELLRKSLQHCGVLVIIGHPIMDTRFQSILSMARTSNATITYIGEENISSDLMANDLHVAHKSDRVLRFMWRILSQITETQLEQKSCLSLDSKSIRLQ